MNTHEKHVVKTASFTKSDDSRISHLIKVGAISIITKQDRRIGYAKIGNYEMQRTSIWGLGDR